MHHINKF